MIEVKVCNSASAMTDDGVFCDALRQMKPKGLELSILTGLELRACSSVRDDVSSVSEQRVVGERGGREGGEDASCIITAA